MEHEDIHQRFLGIAADFAPELERAIDRLGPLPYPRRDDLPFPDYLCRAISGQQISVKAAQSIWGRVVESAQGRPLMEHFTDCQAETLRACGLSGAKTRTIMTIAQTHREQGLDADALREMPLLARNAFITQIWGVGQWTADMMNMFYFGEPDIWPDGDVAARKTLERLTSKRRKTERTAERFKPYRSWLAIYMWAHVDAPPDGKVIS